MMANLEWLLRFRGRKLSVVIVTVEGDVVFLNDLALEIAADVSGLPVEPVDIRL